MALRTRMVVAFVAIAGTLVAAGLVLLALQRAFLLHQVDTRLERQTANAAILATGGSPDQPGPGRAAGARGLADLYVGLIGDSGLVTVATPGTDPDLAPDLTGVALDPGVATTVPSASGEAAQVRVVAAALPDGRTVVLGRSLAEVDAAITGLERTMVILGLVVLALVAVVFWWLRRLGLNPILRVTQVARAIVAGACDQRVDPYPPGTEAQDLGAAFNQLVEQNERTNAALRQFVADASHELRTPLVTLTGYTALYRAGGLGEPEQLDDAMRRIRQEAVRMRRLVDDLLLLADLDQANPSADDPVDLVPIVQDLATDLRVLDPRREVSVAAPAEAVVRGDRDQLAQVLAGLTANALRHTPEGTAIELVVRAAEDVVRVEVIDHGPGIAPEDLPRVFDRFYRSPDARGRAAGGSGLGLAIAAALVRAHHGDIGVSHTPGHGATFWIELPATPTQPA